MLEINGKTILFQGDSITDCSRNRLNKFDLGDGYVQFISEQIQQMHLKQVTIFNKGVYGNRTFDLKLRWLMDLKKFKPDIISLLIGVNDTLRFYDYQMYTSPEKFKENYTYFIETAKQFNPDVQMILMTPFLLPLNQEQKSWFDDLTPKIQIIEELAKEYDLPLISLHHILEPYHNENLTDDGIHPNKVGHKIIADAWIKQMLIE